MIADVRLIGRFDVPDTVESLDAARRWILCSRDFARGGRKLVSVTAQPAGSAQIYAAYPASNLVDGNRQTLLATSDNCASLDVILDTETTARKALLFLEYPEFERVTPTFCALANDPAGPWVDVMESLTPLWAGDRYALWQLPWNKTLATAGAKIEQQLSEVHYRTNYPATDDFLNGWWCVPTGGVNLGMPRRVTDTLSSYDFKVDYPWPQPLVPSTDVVFRQHVPYYTGNRYMKLTLGSVWHPGEGPLRLIGLSLCDYYAQLKGDLQYYRAVRGSNPQELSREAVNPAGVMHWPLNGGLLTEQWGGARDRLRVEWAAAYTGFYEWLKLWAGQGTVGLVDEKYRYQQIAIEELTASALPVDTGGRVEEAVRATLVEV